jgi:hypothetical protein
MSEEEKKEPEEELQFQGRPFSVVYTDSIKRRNVLNNEHFQLFVLGLLIAAPIAFFFVLTALDTQTVTTTYVITFDELATWFFSTEGRLTILTLLVLCLLATNKKR